jgi:hypothetical protein
MAEFRIQASMPVSDERKHAIMKAYKLTSEQWDELAEKIDMSSVVLRDDPVPTLEEWENRRKRFEALPELEKLAVMTGIPVEVLRANGFKDR